MKALTLVQSEDEFLASLELDRLRARAEKAGYAIEEVAGDDERALFYALDTPSLFGDGRFVVVRASTLEAHAERLAAWAESPPPGLAAVLVVGRATKLKKAVGRHAEVIELAAPKPWETADWLVKFLKGRGRVITKEAATALVEAVGTGLRDLANAAEQLQLATTGQIGVDVVARQFRGLDSQVYTFLDAVVQRDRAAALRHLGALLRSGGTHPLVLTTTLANQFRALAAARDAGRQQAAALAKELGVSVGHVNRAFRHGRNFSAGEIRQAFRLLADTDDQLKGGERGQEGSDRLVLELMVARLAGDRPAAPAGRRR